MNKIIKTRCVATIQWLYIAIMPVLFFPIISVLTILEDWSFGESVRVLEIVHGSKKQALLEYLADWGDSLVLSVIIIWFVFLPIHFLLKYKMANKKIPIFFAGLLVWFAVGVFLYGFNLAGILLICIAGLLIESVLIILLSINERA